MQGLGEALRDPGDGAESGAAAGGKDGGDGRWAVRGLVGLVEGFLGAWDLVLSSCRFVLEGRLGVFFFGLFPFVFWRFYGGLRRVWDSGQVKESSLWELVKVGWG